MTVVFNILGVNVWFPRASPDYSVINDKVICTFIRSAGVLIDDTHGCGGIYYCLMENEEDTFVRVVGYKNHGNG